MSILVQKSTKSYWVIVVIVVILVAAYSILYCQNLNQAAVQAQVDQEAYDTAIINACLSHVQEAVDDFYNDYLSISPTVANYVTS